MEVIKGTGQAAKRIIVSKWWETSIVDIPSNPDGLFTVIKSYGDAIEDEHEDQVRYMESEVVKEFVESVEEFLKGGPGSGVKGHRTFKPNMEHEYKAGHKVRINPAYGGGTGVIQEIKRGFATVKTKDGVESFHLSDLKIVPE